MWDPRNQLSVVRMLARKGADDDSECYVYEGGGQRVRKVHSHQTNARRVISEVRYLPGLEIHTHSGSGEILHVIRVSTGANSVQVLHWASEPPTGVKNNQVRYSLDDHLKSSTIELDQAANLISQEWYYPYGATACWAARSAIEAKYKTVRYSGKERDATGLYYYGFRYYAPWLQRWINPDPAGYVDGLNLYRMTRNNPVNFVDDAGLISKAERKHRREYEHDVTIVARGMNAIEKKAPAFYEKIKTAIELSKEMLSNAIEAVQSIIDDEDDGTYEGIIKDFMGTIATPTEIMEKLVPLHAFGRTYGHRSKRIVAVDIPDTTGTGVGTTNAYVHPDSGLDKIYINSWIMNRSDQNNATVLIHEHTHLLDELQTRDFYYLTYLNDPTTIFAQLSALDWLEGRKPLDVQTRNQEDFIAAAEESDYASALKKYYSDRTFRELVSTGNADSWAMMITALSNRFTTQKQHVYV